MSFVATAICWMPSPLYSRRYSSIWLVSSALSLIGMRILPQGEVSARLVKGVGFLMRKNKIDVHTGTAKLTGKDSVEVTGEEGTKIDRDLL